MKKVIIVPYAGLANRMRAISSTIFYANNCDFYTEIYWFKEKNCFAKFSDLFEPIQLHHVIVLDSSKWDLFHCRPNKNNLYISSIFRKICNITEIIDFNKEKDGDFVNLYSNYKKNLYISTCHSICKQYKLNHIFRPIKEIQKEIDKIKSDFSTNTIGIHIRRTDNIKSIANNSVEDFVESIKQELINEPATKFYLATDDVKIKIFLINKFPNNIIFNTATLDRSSVKGIQDAVIDLWCLSSTNKIIGSYYSSYSEIAAELGQIPLKIITK